MWPKDLTDRHNQIDLLSAADSHGIGGMALDGGSSPADVSFTRLGRLVVRQFFFFPGEGSTIEAPSAFESLVSRRASSRRVESSSSRFSLS